MSQDCECQFTEEPIPLAIGRSPALGTDLRARSQLWRCAARRCPLLRGETKEASMERFKNILAVYNQMVGDEATLRRATSLARRNNARLTLAEVVDFRPSSSRPDQVF